MGWRVRDEIYMNPGDVHFGVCDDHRHTDYEQFAQYLWRPWIPKDLYPNYDEEKNWDPNVVQDYFNLVCAGMFQCLIIAFSSVLVGKFQCVPLVS